MMSMHFVRVATLFALAMGMSAAKSQDPAPATDCNIGAIRSVLAAGSLPHVRGCQFDTIAPLLNHYDLYPKRENVASSEPIGTVVRQDPDPHGLTARGTTSTVRLFVSDGSVPQQPAPEAQVDVGLSLEPADSSGVAEGERKLMLFVRNRGPATAQATRIEATLANVEISRVDGGGCTAMPCTVMPLGPTWSATISMVVRPVSIVGDTGQAITFIAIPQEHETAPADNTVSRSFGHKAATPSPSDAPEIVTPAPDPGPMPTPTPTPKKFRWTSTDWMHAPWWVWLLGGVLATTLVTWLSLRPRPDQVQLNAATRPTPPPTGSPFPPPDLPNISVRIAHGQRVPPSENAVHSNVTLRASRGQPEPPRLRLL